MVHGAGDFIMAERKVEVDEGLAQRLVIDAVSNELNDVAACLNALSVLALDEKRLDVVQLDRIEVGDVVLLAVGHLVPGACKAECPPTVDSEMLVEVFVPA